MKMFLQQYMYVSQCIGRHQTVLLVNVVQEKTTRDVKAVIKPSNCENLVRYFLRKLQYLLCLFWFLVNKQSLENGFGFPLYILKATKNATDTNIVISCT